MQFIKPLTLGLLQRCYQQAGQHHWVVTALGFFALGDVAHARFLPESQGWSRVMPLLPSGQALDEAMPKAQAEVLVLGQAHAPHGKAVTQMQVGLELGAVSKWLDVHGDRTWQAATLPRWQPTTAQPFVSMLLGYERAYGGAGFPANPVGKGFDATPPQTWLGQTTLALPNLQLSGTALCSPDQRPQPAALGPMSLANATRQAHAGTYDAQWLKEQCPGLPLDLDWRLYNQAACDQRFAGFLQGGEAYALHGMSATQPCIRGHLPRHRVRALMQSQTGALSLTDLALDTVWMMPDIGLGLLAYRGQFLVDDSNALDVRTLLLAYENLDQPPRTRPYYEQVLALRTDPDHGFEHAFNDSQLAPPSGPSAESAAGAADAGASAMAWQAQVGAHFEAETGLPAPAAKAPPQPSALAQTLPSAHALNASDFDLTACMQQVRQQTQSLQDRMRAMRQQLSSDLAQAGIDPPIPQPATPQYSLQDLVQRAQEQDPLAPIRSMVPPSQAQTLPGPDLGHLPQRLRLASPQVSTAAAQPEPALAKALGQWVMRCVQQGLSLVGRDLAGVDLSGQRLSGVDFSQCQLERANLRDAHLQDCKFDQAVLTQAHLDRAHLERASFVDANLSQARLIGACLDDSLLTRIQAPNSHWTHAHGVRTRWQDANLSDADLSFSHWPHATVQNTLFIKTHMQRSSWLQARFERCIGSRLDASGADFSRAQWQRCALHESDLRQSLWTGGRLEQMQSFRCDWRQAHLNHLLAKNSAWTQAKLEASVWHEARVITSDFSGANLSGAQLDYASFARSLFMGAVLQYSSARACDFFGALLRKADLRWADLTQAQFAQADPAEALFAQPDFSNGTEPGSERP